MGDIGRVRRQQRFIKAVAGSARQSSLDQLFYIMLAAWDNLDTDISFPEAVTLSRRLSGITEENMAMELVPGCFYKPQRGQLLATLPRRNREGDPGSVF